MNNSNGFTLIELVVVIIVLGILAVIAAPQFIDISREAKQQTLTNISGQFKSSLKLAHAEAQIQSLISGSDCVKVDNLADGDEYYFSHGYPQNRSETFNCSHTQNVFFAENFIELNAPTEIDRDSGARAYRSEQLWGFENNNRSVIGYTDLDPSDTSLTMSDINTALSNGNCFVKYKQPNAEGKTPKDLITLDISNC